MQIQSVALTWYIQGPIGCVIHCRKREASPIPGVESAAIRLGTASS